ncbi:hypothetical protein GGR57DRAFT_515624 [Xylariaceae sp. FL1272]|nr:hypothetical protein GGR57DRAFT_515624 [Xylariaceae sp. FL1272]
MENQRLQRELNELKAKYGPFTIVPAPGSRRYRLTIHPNLSQLLIELPSDYPSSNERITIIDTRKNGHNGDPERDRGDFARALDTTFRAGTTYLYQAIELVLQRRGLSASRESSSISTISGPLALRPAQQNPPRDRSPQKRVLSASSAGVQSPPKKSKEMAAVPPGEEEAVYYYHGLVGGRLVARTGTNPFVLQCVRTEDGDSPKKKIYKALGAHRSDIELIRQIRPLLRRIAKTLEDNDVLWVWFTAIRIGYTYREDEMPPVLLVNVEPGKVSFEAASRTASQLKTLLRSNNADIEVEFREYLLQNQAASAEIDDHVQWPKFDPMDDVLRHETNDYTLPLLSNSGWCAHYPDSNGYGSVGLFVTLSGSPKKVFGLTAAHVVEPKDKKSVVVRDGVPLRDVFQGPPSFTKLINQLKEHLKVLKADKRPKEEVTYAQKLVSLIESSKDLKKRTVGRVAWSQEYEKSRTEAGVLNDWALIELHSKKFKNAANQVFVDTNHMICLQARNHTSRDLKSFVPALSEEEVKIASSIKEKWANAKGFLRFESTEAHVGQTLKSSEGLPCTRVLKYGVTTGLTIGLTNGVEAVFRKQGVGETGEREPMLVWNLLVVPLPNQDPSTETRKGLPPRDVIAFSAHGDSGSAVVSWKGDVLGMVVGGGLWIDRYQWRGKVSEVLEHRVGTPYQSGKEPKDADDPTPEKEPVIRKFTEAQRKAVEMDITFVEPMDRIFRDIQNLTGQGVKIYHK